MAASTNPIVLAGTLLFPPDEGAAQVPISFGLSSNYKAVVDSRLDMVGSGTQAVPFGTIVAPGAKIVLIEYENAQGAAPVNIKVNGGSDNIELSPGGVWVYASPTPATGITSLSIVRTTDAVIRVRLFG